MKRKATHSKMRTIPAQKKFIRRIESADKRLDNVENKIERARADGTLEYQHFKDYERASDQYHRLDESLDRRMQHKHRRRE